MKMTWEALNSKTSSFRTLLETPDNEKGEIRDVVFSGLQVKLSEILKNRAPGAGKTLTIYADTLVMDAPSLNAAVTVVVARCIDVTGLQGGLIKVPAPGPGDYSVSTLLIQESAGGSPVLVPSKAGTDGTAYPLPLFRSAAPRVVYFTLGSDGESSLEIVEEESRKAHLENLLDKVWSLNSLKASFTAATWLMDSGSVEDLSTARSMLIWVTACIRSWGADSGPISSDFVELYHSAAALLVTLIAEEGAYYVPVLASSYYSDHVKTLCDALSKYEIHLSSLNVQSGIEAVLQSVGSAIEGATADSIAPLQTELDQIDKNIENLLGDIRILNRQFHSQQVESDRNLKVLSTKITQDAIFQRMMTTLMASFEIIMAVGTAGGALSTLSKNPVAKLGQGFGSLNYFLMTDILGNEVSPVPALKDAFGGVRDGVKGGLKIYSALTNNQAAPDKELLNRALSLMKMQEQSLAAFVTGALLVSEPAEGAESTLPEIGASDRADPKLAWDNFMIEAEVVLKPMESSESSEVKGALASFHGSLKVLAGYGKAVNAKLVSAAAQMSTGTLVRARLRAAESTKERWASLQAKAKTDDEKLAALRGIVQVGLDGLKRSIFTAWTQYRNSFFYLNFQDPPRVIKMDMDAAGLSKAFASVNAWIARLRGDTAEGKQVKLPDDDVTITFNLKIVRPEEAGGPGTARLTPGAGSEPARIEWTIPAGDEQLLGVLPQKGNVAIWIKEAEFFLKGVTPNSKGNVIAKVSTSGSYENGFGPEERYRFDTKSLVGNYAYTATLGGGRIYNRWKIDAEVYATPTPFTQWMFAFDPDGGDPSSATALQMNLVVAYSERGQLTVSAGQA